MDEYYERRDRVLLRPWLENMLETGSIPGLEWFDKDQMMFKVPWKHRSKKDWSLRHSSVFLVCNFTTIYIIIVVINVYKRFFSFSIKIRSLVFIIFPAFLFKKHWTVSVKITVI